MDTILLVEDKVELRQMLEQALERMGFQVAAVPGAAQALRELSARHFSVVLTDLKLPSGSGMEVLKAALDADPALPVVIMTAYGSIAEAVQAMRDGAYDFIQKPIDLDHLQQLLGRAVERQQLLRENIVLREEYARQLGFPRIIGEHPAMQAAAREMQRIAPSDSTVLLLGESGTGKELFARAIHRLSPRGPRPFVAINCAAIPETLVENELFGHERGAFTGAAGRKAGKFELAHGGSIFLDEIGELPPGAQGKLLRVLEERVVERLGGTAPVQVDVRVIAATNRNLEDAVQQGGFRPDLYYRLAVFPIRIPPLRERGNDVLVLAESFLERFRQEMKKPRLAFSGEARDALRQHAWPGNVRELQNAIERAAILNDGELAAADLGLSSGKSSAAAAAASTSDARGERERLEAALRECKWNKTAAAQRLGISYRSLLSKVRTYGLD